MFSCNEKQSERKKLISVKKCKYNISIDKYGLVNTFYLNPDTIKLNSKSYLIVELYSCEGELDFKEFSVDSGLVLEGYYKGAAKLTRGVSESINPSDGTSTLDSTKYYIPFKTGEWKYYNRKGDVIKMEKYSN